MLPCGTDESLSILYSARSSSALFTRKTFDCAGNSSEELFRPLGDKTSPGASDINWLVGGHGYASKTCVVAQGSSQFVLRSAQTSTCLASRKSHKKSVYKTDFKNRIGNSGESIQKAVLTELRYSHLANIIIYSTAIYTWLLQYYVVDPSRTCWLLINRCATSR